MKREPQKNCHCCDHVNYSRYPCADTYRCDQCGHIYRHYKEDVAEFHEGDDYRAGQFEKDKKSFKSLGPLREAKRAIRCQNQLGLVKQYIKENESLMDLATGTGVFLKEAKKYYKNLKGSDIHRTVATHNAIANPEVEIIISDVFLMDEDVTYDGITAFDVLEHIDDISKFVEKVHKISNKYFILQVPCDREPFPPPNEPFHHWNAHCAGQFDGHVHYYTEQSLKTLFCKNNLFSSEIIRKVAPGILANGAEMIAVFKKTEKLSAKDPI